MPTPQTLDAARRAKLIGYISHGCSRRVAARVVGCSAATITRTAARDPDFAADLARAEHYLEVETLKHIRDAARDPRHWRAAAWLLERRNPDDFASRSNQTYTSEQVVQLFNRVTLILSQEVPEENCRRAIQKLQHILLELDSTAPPPDSQESPP